MYYFVIKLLIVLAGMNLRAQAAMDSSNCSNSLNLGPSQITEAIDELDLPDLHVDGISREDLSLALVHPELKNLAFSAIELAVFLKTTNSDEAIKLIGQYEYLRAQQHLPPQTFDAELPYPKEITSQIEFLKKIPTYELAQKRFNKIQVRLQDRNFTPMTLAILAELSHEIWGTEEEKASKIGIRQIVLFMKQFIQKTDPLRLPIYRDFF